MDDISNWIAYRANWSPEKAALRFAGQTYDYAAFEARIGKLARMLKDELKLAAGDRVAHLGYNSVEMLELLFACARIGAIMVPLNWRLAAPEHAWILNNCGPSALLAEADFTVVIDSIAGELPAAMILVNYDKTPAAGWLSYQGLLAEAETAVGPGGGGERPLLIVYTSGTTGKPKGTVLTQEALFYNALNSVAVHDMSSQDHVLSVLPMFHVGGMNVQTTPALYMGATVTLHARFDPDAFLNSVAADRPTVSLAVPAVTQALIQHPDWAETDLSSLRLVSTGSSTVPEALIRPWLDRGIALTQVYGLTETGPVSIALRIEDATSHLGSCGKPAPHGRARIGRDDGSDAAPGEKGEILLQGRNLFSAYWQAPELTAASFTDGWFHTGDIGHVDEDGFYYVDDRKKDVIISGGENIYPAELEQVLADCDGLVEWAVIGESDPRWVEIPIACVVAKPGSGIDGAAVLALFEGRLARFKHPKRVIFMDSLPRTALGKVRKFELREALEGD